MTDTYKGLSQYFHDQLLLGRRVAAELEVEAAPHRSARYIISRAWRAQIGLDEYGYNLRTDGIPIEERFGFHPNRF